MTYTETLQTADSILTLLGAKAKSAAITNRGLNTATLRIKTLSTGKTDWNLEAQACKADDGSYKIRAYLVLPKTTSNELITFYSHENLTAEALEAAYTEALAAADNYSPLNLAHEIKAANTETKPKQRGEYAGLEKLNGRP